MQSAAKACIGCKDVMHAVTEQSLMVHCACVCGRSGGGSRGAKEIIPLLLVLCRILGIVFRPERSVVAIH